MTAWNPVRFLRELARNSPWALIAVALHLIVLAGAAVFVTTRQEAKPDESPNVTYTPRPNDPEIPIPPLPLIDRRSIPAQDESAQLVDEYIPDTIPIDPTSEADQIGELLAESEFGDPGIDASSSIGVGIGGSRGARPSPFPPRGPGKIPRKGGPPSDRTKIIDEAVLGGLTWLARHQSRDGSWSAKGLGDACTSDPRCVADDAHYVDNFDVGLTGLALLSYLGAGYGHDAKAWIHDPVTKKKYVVGDIVKRGLRWLEKQQQSDGSFGTQRVFMYNEALATMAMCEAYGLTRARAWRDPAQKAVDFLQAAQRPSPQGSGAWGWRYASRQEVEQFHRGDSLDADFAKELYDADVSVTGWCVMALKSADLCGLKVDPQALQGGLAFAKWVTAPDGSGLVGYLDPKSAGRAISGPDDQFTYHVASPSALGMCIRIFTEHDASDPFLEQAAKLLIKDLPARSADKLSIDYYYWYYGSLALNQFDGPDSPRRGGKYWPQWNKAMLDAILPLQDSTKDACRRGGWVVPDRWCHSGGPIYATALNVLTLEVYFRYPNAFGMARKQGDTEAAQEAPAEQRPK